LVLVDENTTTEDHGTATVEAKAMAKELHAAEERLLCNELVETSVNGVLVRMTGKHLAKRITMRCIKRGHRQHERRQSTRTLSLHNSHTTWAVATR
jgi:hypothetical protein